MPVYRANNWMLEGISVEFLDAESVDITTANRDWSHKRITAPCNTLLPSTLLWATALPSEVVPTEMMKNFPRIANLLAANWKDPQGFYNYMRGLLTDSRGNRQGFPFNVKQELLKLRASYDLGKVEHPSALEREISPNQALSSTDSTA